MIMIDEQVTVPTIVTVEEPSQASEGKFDSLPINRIIFSLPRGNISGSIIGFSTRRFIWRKWKATHCIYP